MKKIYVLLLFIVLASMVKGQINLPGFRFLNENKMISSEREVSFIFLDPNNHSSSEIITTINQALQQQNINWTRATRIGVVDVARYRVYFSVDVLSGTASRYANLYTIPDYSYAAIIQLPPITLQSYWLSADETKFFVGSEHEMRLNGSQKGVTYSLMYGDTPVKSLVGTGSALVFKFYAANEGVYKVKAKYVNDSLMMSGQVYLSLYDICNTGVISFDSLQYILYQFPAALKIDIHINVNPTQLPGYIAELQKIVDYCNAGKIVTWSDTLEMELLTGEGNTRELRISSRFKVDKYCYGILLFNYGTGLLQILHRPVMKPKEWHHVKEYTTVTPGNQVLDITYMDNLGREMQRVSVKGSPSGKDVIQPVVYDAVGRSSKEYLPYAIAGSGSFRENALVQQDSFYQARYGDSHYAFTESVYDNTVDDKVVEQSGPGASWRLGGGHTTRSEYRLNEAGDQVKKYELEGSSVKLSGQYKVGALQVVKVTDPQNNVSFEYRDWKGNLIAKETRLSSGKRVLTYSVYDEMGKLRYIIPPLQDSLFTSGTKTLSDLSKYCYYMEYDEYGRMYKRYNPGAGVVIHLYDKRGRLVFTQDGEQRVGNKWSFRKYDELNREVISGICTGNEVDLRTALQAQTVFGERRGTALHGYTNVTCPTGVTTAACHLITYYDDYNWTGQSQVAYSLADAIGDTKNSDVLGHLTGTKIKVLGITSDQWLLSAEYYDGKYRAVQSVKQLYPSGTEIASNAHDFSDRVIRVKLKQTVGSLVTEYNKYFTYDERGRELKVEQQITGDNVNGRVTLVENVYDELGHMSSSKLHNGGEVRSYHYNVGGSVTGVSSSRFSYSLSYDQVSVSGAVARYDGNVNALTWKNNNGTEKAYLYTYDPMGQLGSASYKEKNGSNWINSTGKFNVSGLSYDLNGNLKSLRRNDSGGAALHTLSYTYNLPDNGNAVSQVTLNGTLSGTYAYNANGNMTVDGRRGVTIHYNDLNLPSEVIQGSEKVSYIYSALGEKLAMQVNNRSGSSLTYYRGAMVYNGNSLNYILHPVGMTRKVSSGFVYDYFLTDHLGSTRVVLEASGSTLTAIQTTEYYPFGLAFTCNSLDKNKYLFSGKEIQDVEIGGKMLNLLDFGSRFYDPIVARWLCQDPFFQFVMPYGYCGNNPILCIDADGEFAWILIPIAIGAISNVIENWDDISSAGGWKAVGKFLGYAALGGGNGALSFCCPGWGSVAGEGAMGMGNMLIRNGMDGSVTNVLRTGLVRAGSAFVGGNTGRALGKLAGKGLNNLYANIWVNQLASDVMESETSGFVTNFGISFMNNGGNFNAALKDATKVENIVLNGVSGLGSGVKKVLDFKADLKTANAQVIQQKMELPNETVMPRMPDVMKSKSNSLSIPEVVNPHTLPLPMLPEIRLGKQFTPSMRIINHHSIKIWIETNKVIKLKIKK